MDSESIRQLIEASSLSDEERLLALENAPPGEPHEYLKLVDQLSTLDVPPPSSAKRWSGRLQLLEAVERQHEPSRQPLVAPFLRWARAVPIAATAGAVLTLSAAAAVATDVELPGRPVNEVLSALGLKAGSPETPATAVPNTPVTATPDATAAAQDAAGGIGTPTPDASPAADKGENRENQGQGVEPPGQGGENPGQGVEPPGQGGENPGQGVEPPGQGGENPGQGVEPPGQGGANPGNGESPPGHDVSPGQSGDASGQSGENPGGSGSENGQGQGNKP
jgi:hypothetical protein